ncbi:MAG: type I glyceraldehyde-3-phosphate dehydrogenase [Parcubacteria group bacterium CG11_big_fil_rev_8_21_14_0_20_39_22]|nr:MAG: type I glyceraldehyde-3-phosphate dehydrogenase [Parcubacteria group bacterium CG11_big_fil_rev_8_21_14_0_20_39_22]
MKKTRVAINGFGRIGRAFFALALNKPEIEVVAVNDLADIENMAYLLKYDSVYHHNNLQDVISVEADADDSTLKVEGKSVKYLSEKYPSKLPWGELEIDVVVESTGFFTSYEKSKAHLDAGAKKVVISAPVKGDAPEGISGDTVLMGINEERIKTCDITSNASCTTNAGSPVIAILDEEIGIEKALLNTVHGYTSTQSLVDGPGAKDVRRGRAAAQNIVPSSTGAAIATTKVIKSLSDKFDGVALRVPVPVGSIVDITFIAKRETDAEEVNQILSKASQDSRWKGIFSTTDEPIVSTDIIGNSHASIADLSMTRVVGGNLVKVLAWYDNEVGYTNTLVRHVIKTGEQLK